MRARFRLTNDQSYYGLDIDVETQAKIEAALVDDAKLKRYPDDHYQVEARGKVDAHVEYEGDVEQVMGALAGMNVRVELLGIGAPRPILDLYDELRQMRERLDGLSDQPDTYINNKVDVHVPGAPLLEINDVRVFPDLCTEELQRLLEGTENGVNDPAGAWRILAICPQPDQRRPDYILGRRREET